MQGDDDTQRSTGEEENLSWSLYRSSNESQVHLTNQEIDEVKGVVSFSIEGASRSILCEVLNNWVSNLKEHTILMTE